MPKILLVEDNELNRDMLARRLQRRGHEVVVAVDGNQGLAMARSEAPALILMDRSLPELDGWEATRRLKAAPETRAIPVIALTAHAMAGDGQEALAAYPRTGQREPTREPLTTARCTSGSGRSRLRPGRSSEVIRSWPC